MRVTNVSLQLRNPNRVNISVDGKYRFSLDISQVTSLGLKVGSEYSEDELQAFETESEFGKLYTLALEYCFVRPRSSREVRDYLYRKTRSTRLRSRRTGEWYEKPGVSVALTERVFQRLVERSYIDDEVFTRYWIENRNHTKGASRKKLTVELRQKGIEQSMIDQCLVESDRNDESELRKVVAKKQRRYPDEQKFIQYLMRQGFSYDDVRRVLSED